MKDSEVFPNLSDAVNFTGLGRKGPVWGAGSLQDVEFSQKQVWSWEERPPGSLVGKWQHKELLTRSEWGTKG